MNVAQAQDRLLLLIQAVPNELSKATAEIAADAALIFGAYAPKGRTGRLARGIKARIGPGASSVWQLATGRQFAVIASVEG